MAGRTTHRPQAHGAVDALFALGTTTTAETAGKGIAMARKTTTAADIAAAIALGVMPESTPIITPEDAARQAEEAARAAVADALATETARQARRAATTTPTTLDAAETAEHRCTQRGCRHGSHSGPTQPDRQAKMVAPCGAVLRITTRALARAGGAITCGHGDPFVIDPTRRKYGTPKTAETAPAA